MCIFICMFMCVCGRKTVKFLYTRVVLLRLISIHFFIVCSLFVAFTFKIQRNICFLSHGFCQHIQLLFSSEFMIGGQHRSAGI